MHKQPVAVLCKSAEMKTLLWRTQNAIWCSNYLFSKSDLRLVSLPDLTLMKELNCMVLIYCMNSSMWAAFIAAIGKHLFKQNVSVRTTAPSEFRSERWKVDNIDRYKTQCVSSATLQEIGMPNCGPSSAFLLN